jgi:predicted AlkP superfamily phosphohydrolase/phosphomutase
VILVLGVDALDYDLSLKYGLEYAKEGYFADYKSAYWSTVPSWTSIYTGMTREEHGCPPGWHDWLYNQVKTVKPDDVEEQELPIIYEKPYRELPFVWNLLNHQGKSTGVFKMPLTFPAHRVKGWMVSGFPAVKNKRAIYPVDAMLQLHDYSPGILQRLENNFITNFKKIDGLIERGHTIDAKLTTQHIMSALNNLTRLLEWNRPDVLFVGYSFLDHIGHMGIRKEQTQEAVYKLVDWAITETRDLCEADATIIVSDHGGVVRTLDTFKDRTTEHPPFLCFPEMNEVGHPVTETMGPWEHTESGVFWMTEPTDPETLHEYDVTRHILRLAKQFT